MPDCRKYISSPSSPSLKIQSLGAAKHGLSILHTETMKPESCPRKKLGLGELGLGELGLGLGLGMKPETCPRKKPIDSTVLRLR